ncbi:aspartyl protease family protein [Pantoea sp. EA-12]|uniref:retropepsin-like aspartic protease n=1 Tax=Pantoea sp. EA-12 TaxID=3043303 RepID=UPI0024B50755|nr:retropepsin-like aspartic protease [Pantoea sp. EA-12]MDI9222682.1 aspartyl protease family protein [Pantoea sp. EA-12]
MKGLLRNGILILALASIPLAEAVITLPFNLDESALPIVKVNINGQEGEFMVDSGSQSAFHFTQAYMRHMPNLKRLKEKARTTDLTGKVFLNDKFKFHHVYVNGMSFENVEGVSLTPWGLTLLPDGKRPEHMVIGLGLFKQKVLMMDYPQQTFTVANQFSELNIINDEWLSLPLTVSDEGIIIDVTHNNENYKMMLDTGATVSLLWKERINETSNTIDCQRVMAEMDNNNCEATQVHIKDTAPGKFNVNVLVLEGDFQHMKADGLLGTNFLQNHAVLIDFPNNQLMIRSTEPG